MKPTKRASLQQTSMFEEGCEQRAPKPEGTRELIRAVADLLMEALGAQANEGSADESEDPS